MKIKAVCANCGDVRSHIAISATPNIVDTYITAVCEKCHYQNIYSIPTHDWWIGINADNEEQQFKIV